MAKYGTFAYGTAKYGAGTEPEWVLNRKESDLINNTPYAYINYTDLNRIETRISELGELLGLELSVKTNWEKASSDNFDTNTPTKAETDRILQNIQSILTEVEDLGINDINAQIPESFDNLDIYDVNDIEKLLYVLKNKILKYKEGQ